MIFATLQFWRISTLAHSVVHETEHDLCRSISPAGEGLNNFRALA